MQNLIKRGVIDLIVLKDRSNSGLKLPLIAMDLFYYNTKCYDSGGRKHQYLDGWYNVFMKSAITTTYHKMSCDKRGNIYKTSYNAFGYNNQSMTQYGSRIKFIIALFSSSMENGYTYSTPTDRTGNELSFYGVSNVLDALIFACDSNIRAQGMKGVPVIMLNHALSNICGMAFANYSGMNFYSMPAQLVKNTVSKLIIDNLNPNLYQIEPGL